MINRRFHQKSEKSNTNNSYIFIAKESFFDHIRCIRDLGYCYWWKKCGRGERHMQVGDIVYLFISDKTHNRVMYRLEVWTRTALEMMRNIGKRSLNRIIPASNCKMFRPFTWVLALHAMNWSCTE